MLIAAVPVKRLEAAKSRLGRSVPDRPALALALLDRVLAALRESGVADETVVVSPDARIAANCRTETFLLQRGRGLNPALDEARAYALGRGADALLVVLADLPGLTPEALQRLVACEGPAVLAPDRHDQGTNALLLRPPGLLPFRFGAGSLRLHRQEAEGLGVPMTFFRTPETMNDLDTPEHLPELKTL